MFFNLLAVTMYLLYKGEQKYKKKQGTNKPIAYLCGYKSFQNFETFRTFFGKWLTLTVMTYS